MSDLVAALLLIATLGVLLIGPICYLCISGYREDKAERVRLDMQRAQALEHDVWPDRTPEWFGHKSCSYCETGLWHAIPGNSPVGWVQVRNERTGAIGYRPTREAS
jgi:hypothetical protein